MGALGGRMGRAGSIFGESAQLSLPWGPVLPTLFAVTTYPSGSYRRDPRVGSRRVSATGTATLFTCEPTILPLCDDGGRHLIRPSQAANCRQPPSGHVRLARAAAAAAAAAPLACGWPATSVRRRRDHGWLGGGTAFPRLRLGPQVGEVTGNNGSTNTHHRPSKNGRDCLTGLRV